MILWRNSIRRNLSITDLFGCSMMVVTIVTVMAMFCYAEPLMVNINTADVEEFMLLPGIGEVKATDIVAYRDVNGPFATIDELLNVNGIGEATLEKIRPFIYVGDNPLPVTFAGLHATKTRDGMLITWITEMEVNSVGFYVHRWNGKTNQFYPERLNERIIPAKGAGTKYKFIDVKGNPHPTSATAYIVVEVDFQGNQQNSKLFQAPVGQNKKLKLMTWGKIKTGR